MMKRKFRTPALLLMTILWLTFAYCKKDVVPQQPQTAVPDDSLVAMTPYELKSFSPLLHEPFIPEDNQMYVERIQLGRMLYYDPILSNDGRACASCHLQPYGFTVPGTVDGMPVLPHINLAWNEQYMWDGSKTGTVEDLMLFEVAEFFGTNLDKMNASETYRRLFKMYYGADTIGYKELSYALAQFMRTLVSSDSKYDKFLRGMAALTPDEQAGMQIFFTEKGDCFHCHIAHVMTDNSLHNIGLDNEYLNDRNKGYYKVTGNPADMGKFRTPNLRNAGLRKKYMHDGRFSTLEEVVEFYNTGVQKSATLDPIMTKAGKQNGLQLSPLDKMQLIAFLHTLTDSIFISRPELGAP